MSAADLLCAISTYSDHNKDAGKADEPTKAGMMNSGSMYLSAKQVAPALIGAAVRW